MRCALTPCGRHARVESLSSSASAASGCERVHHANIDPWRCLGTGAGITLSSVAPVAVHHGFLAVQRSGDVLQERSMRGNPYAAACDEGTAVTDRIWRLARASSGLSVGHVGNDDDHATTVPSRDAGHVSFLLDSASEASSQMDVFSGSEQHIIVHHIAQHRIVLRDFFGRQTLSGPQVRPYLLRCACACLSVSVSRNHSAHLSAAHCDCAQHSRR